MTFRFQVGRTIAEKKSGRKGRVKTRGTLDEGGRIYVFYEVDWEDGTTSKKADEDLMAAPIPPLKR